MLIEIDKPEFEALIQQHLDSGAFQTVEDVVMQALKFAPLPQNTEKQIEFRTGADLVAAMQAMPYKEIDIDPKRPNMPVRDVDL